MSKTTAEHRFKEAVDAVSRAYSPRRLQLFLDALQTALDDSEDWAKYSDPGDNRRSAEQRDLNSMYCLFVNARNLAESRKAKP